ncbi:hypothetical protein WJX75_004710 [Coccomyxa subellipsoidea]|uniref:Uncharacterized protein n=1 Tax=Coccomyxa subellipsoidea TaxID=248742 RepID=A0ABR2YPS6_9CHLO
MIDFAIGIVTAVGSAAAFGSFGVPIKCKQILDAKVDPLAYQFYKSLKAGLGIAQTTWSALSIFVSFIWGAFVFHEPIKSLPLSFVGLFLMALGMSGLGYAAQQVAANVFKTDKSAEGEQSSPQKALLAAKKKNFVIGVVLACCIGVTNGSFLVPLKYAQKDVKGIIYVLSFGIGAALVTLTAGALYAIGCKLIGRPVPSLQVRVASGPALLTGALWSTAGRG